MSATFGSLKPVQHYCPIRIAQVRATLIPPMLACLLIISPTAAFGNSSQPATAAKQSARLRVIGADEREVVTDTTVYPWSAIGRIEAIWHQSVGYAIVNTGTGALIGNQVVLTGGHVVYDQELGWADEIQFAPGRNGSEEPFGRAWSVRTIAQRAWVEQSDYRYDLAMLVLDWPIGEQAGYMPVAVEAESFFNDRNINTSGYPGEDRPGTIQYHAYGSSIDVQDGLIRHYLDSEPGQSGSPMWVYDPETDGRRLVGVLTGSREFISNGQIVEAYNVGVHINASFAKWIQETLAEHDNVVQDIPTDESTSSPSPVCGAGAPVAMVMLVLVFPLLRWRGGTRSAGNYCRVTSATSRSSPRT